ncbi:hypothetical protein [Couchioplanes caeruleus]|uniref:Uncharacterized protein n=1 Tax=Couchioplanes caeruleus subsp. caeruleus TaxID=56427 RepID=A0A1K0FE63_9ACTN|nr:hypothetical protein [Couchioplanes caeruleus]OJF11127.1 hypothetical protein BG844_28735 [Couchioplanes caeruleus subsp. caeruleus]
MYSEIFAELAGVTMPPPLQPPQEPPNFDTGRHAGTYLGHEHEHEVLDHDGVPGLRWAVTGSPAEVMPTAEGEYETIAAGKDLLLYREPGQHRWRPATFVQLPDGRPGLYIGLRADTRAI